MDSNPIMLQPLPAGKQYGSFSLNLEECGIALLPDEHELVINLSTGHFMLINWDVRHIVADGLFSEAELPMMLTLLHSWPSYIQNEKLLQAITGRSAEEITALLDSNHHAALEPLHRLVEGCRAPFRTIGIEIQNVSGQGYKLSRYAPARKESQE
jgi:hypothetical protein